MRKKASFLALFLVLCLWTEQSASYNNTSLKWRTISTPRFEVHFHQGEEWTAEEVARVVEEIYPFITSLYRYEPKDKVHFVIRDTDDYANGITYFYDNKIEIWATNLEFNLRGTSRWIQNVVTHEFTHLISLQAGFKLPRRIPALYFQLIDFEKEKRSDVLTGYPSHIVSYPFAGVVIPPWFAEGIAQYQSPARRYDCWDTHRDMILRCAVLEDRMLTYDEMGFFGHTGLGNEEVYDHGYALVRYIASRYGPESLKAIVRAMRSLPRINLDGALKGVTGKTGTELYEDWREELREHYGAQAALVEKNLREGRELFSGGYMTIAPSWSPDGKRIAFLSNRKSDFSGTSLYLIDKSGGGLEMVSGGVGSRAVFSPDGAKLLYAKRVRADRYGSRVNDLFLYDIGSGKEKKLTRALRASDPDFSPDGGYVVCVLNSDGTHRLAVMRTDGSGREEIFSAEKGTQLYSPHFSPDGGRILFGIFTGSTRDVAMISRDGSGFHYLLRSLSDERDAVWAPGGGRVVFSSDRTGIFNIYELDLESSSIKQLTNVVGGAFMPDVSSADGALVFAGFHAEGYRLHLLEGSSEPIEVMDVSAYESGEAVADEECALLKEDVSRRDLSGWKAAGSGGGSGPGGEKRAVTWKDPPLRSLPSGATTGEPYRSRFTPFQFYPRFVLYDRTPRFGIFLTSNEILDKQNFYFGGSIGTNKEFDAFVSYELRELYPTIFVELVRLREYFDERLAFKDSSWNLKLRYDLWQADLGVRLEFEEDIYSLTEKNEFELFLTHGEYGVHIDAEIFNKYGEFLFSDAAGWKYYIGNEITTRYRYKQIAKAVDSDINPRGGREVTASCMLAFDKLFTSGEFEYGFHPLFDRNYYGQYSLEWIEYFALPYLRHTLQVKLYAAAIDRKVNDFFYVYLGGRDGIRGYTYYSIGGRRGLLGSVTYRFPIWRNINRQLFHLYFRDIYGGLFCEAANGWTKNKLETRGYKKSLGFELRFNLGSFYTFPTTFSIVSAYALDTLHFADPVYADIPIVHEKGWRSYLSVGFTF